MISLCKPSFWTLYRELPQAVREQAKLNYARFMANPSHPGLHFKPLAGCPDWWSVRVGLHYRAVGQRQGDTIRWFWIGSHADYDRLTSS